jgi:FMN-dependent NADH-azoreductase
MWNAGVPYILKQFIDVVSQPGTVFGVDPATGYIPLLAGRGQARGRHLHQRGVGPGLGVEFGRDFQSTYFDDWLRWTGIDDVTAVATTPPSPATPPRRCTTRRRPRRDAAKTF